MTLGFISILHSYKSGLEVLFEDHRVWRAVEVAVVSILAVGGVRGAVGRQQGAALQAPFTVGSVVVAVVCGAAGV